MKIGSEITIKSVQKIKDNLIFQLAVNTKYNFSSDEVYENISKPVDIQYKYIFTL